MSYFPKISVAGADCTTVDAFGRWRVSEPSTLFDSKLMLDSAPQFWDDQSISGTGTSSTYNKNRASMTLAVSASTAGKRVRQSKRWWNYQPGKSQLILMTFVMGPAVAGVTKRIGQHNEFNGIFLQQTSTDIRWVIRSSVTGSPVDTNYATQANWNYDKFDGTGPSGVTLDLTKTQILFIDYEWLGVGRVRCGFVISGQFLTCHYFLNANVNTAVYMSSPNLPIRYSIENSGAGAAASLETICCTVISEGGRSDIGYERCVSRGAIGLKTLNNDDIYPLIAIRLSGTALCTEVKLTSLSALSTSNSAFNWYWIENPQITGGSFYWTDTPNSGVQADFQNTGTVICIRNTGTVIHAGVVAAAESFIAPQYSEMKLGSFLNGVSDVWVLAVQRITGTTETFFGCMNWREAC